jgi:hypothetical protein
MEGGSKERKVNRFWLLQGIFRVIIYLITALIKLQIKIKLQGARDIAQ